MSDKDELARLRGEVAALKDILVATIRSARGSTRGGVSSSPVGPVT